MSLLFLITFYFTIAACEIIFPEQCLSLFEKLIGKADRIRFLSALMFFIALLYYIARPTRLQWLIIILFWIYLLSGIWFLVHPQSFISLCDKSYVNLPSSEKRIVLRWDCALRTILALLLIYAI